MPRWFRSIVVVALLSAPALARAQTAGAGTPPAAPSAAGSAGPAGTSVTALTAERQKVRVALDRVNAEIDTLKHDNRGLREDYRLRARMADAESLAQRLTDLDVRIERLNPGAGRRADATLPAAPEARPTDDRAALEAKADIVADQARRLEHQADVLAGRVTDLRGRQELRRRAGQLERDPFSPLEQSKRRVANGTPQSAGPVITTGGPAVPGRGTESQPGTSTPGPGGPTVGGVAPPPGTTGATDSAKTVSTTAGSVAPTAMPVGASSGDAPGSVAGQFRGILDAATLAEIRRLESAGASGSSLHAMERALSALRTRATQLNASAAALRSRAKTAQ